MYYFVRELIKSKPYKHYNGLKGKWAEGVSEGQGIRWIRISRRNVNKDIERTVSTLTREQCVAVGRRGQDNGGPKWFSKLLGLESG